MAGTLSCSTACMLHNAPVAVTQTSRQPTASSTSSQYLRRQLGSNDSLKLSYHKSGHQFVPKRGHVSLPRASTNGDNVRELASEKAVESGQQVTDDSAKLAKGKNPAALDAKAEEASDAASDNGDMREKVLDVASDMAVDGPPDVDALAKKDAEPLAKEFGQSVENTAEALESKAAEVSDREARKES